jgi:hypothetical protein
MNQLADKEGLFINKKLIEWKYSRDYDASEYDNDNIEPPISEIERDALKLVSNDVDYDFDNYANDGVNMNYNNDVRYDLSSDANQPSLEQQSDELLQDFDPSIIENTNVEEDDDFDAHYWPVARVTSPTEEF